MKAYTVPADGNWHLIGERIISIVGPPLVDIDIREDGTGWVRNLVNRPIEVDYIQQEAE